MNGRRRWKASSHPDESPGTAAVATVMSMSVAPFIPKSMPLLVGTQEILKTEQKFGRTSAALLEPPVDLEANNPSWDAAEPDFRSFVGSRSGAFTVVLVSRLAKELKLEGILAAIDCVGLLSKELRIQLLIAGDGPARQLVESHALSVNERKWSARRRTYRGARGSPCSLRSGRCCPRHGRIGAAGAGLCETTDRSRRTRVLGTPDSGHSATVP